MTEGGRKYGLLKYGGFTYDHMPQWTDIPSLIDGWNPLVDDPPSEWGGIFATPEIWTPVTVPSLGE